MNKAQQNATDFSKAMGCLQQGRFAEAISIYEAILQREPKNAGAANLLGIALMQTGRMEEAAEAIRKGLRANPSQPDAHYNLAAVLQALRRAEEAIPHLREVIALRPGDAQAHNNLGVALKSAERSEDAMGAYSEAIRLKPDYAEAHVNLATLLFSLKRYGESISHAQKAISLNPGLAEAHLAFGNSLQAENRIDEALGAFDRVIALQPNRPEAYANAGVALAGGGYYKRAIPLLERAIALQPDTFALYFQLASCLYLTARHEEAHAVAERGFARTPAHLSVDDEIAVGSFLQEANRHEEAGAHFQKAIEQDPNSAGGHLGYGRALEIAGRHKEALYHFDRAIELTPDNDMLLWNKAIVCLSLENFSEGWKLFEKRFSERVLFATPRNHAAPRWNGGKLSGALAVWGEQGLGDQIIYASMLSDVSKDVASLILEVEPRLIPLFVRSFPKASVRALSDDPAGSQADAHVPFGGLGEFYRRQKSDFPQRAYLSADSARTDALRRRLSAAGKVSVGVSWRSANQRFGIHKTARLQDLHQIFSRPDIQLIDLQYGDTSAERDNVRQEYGVEVLHIDEVDNTKDIDGLAALISACDAVLTVSNTTAHIAGALGKPVWILVPHAQGRLWYWFHERSDSLWYPGARIVRQQPGQSWADLVASITPEISEFALGLKSKT